ncbi:MAG TPA: ATP-binding protein [Kofleriaceae bacterium]|nr:ATP-binding protein [Kofleriaceae bacterium]
MSSLRITPTMLHSIDRDGRIQEVSDLWLQTLGYTWEEVIGRRSTEFLSEESARYAREVVLPAFFQTGTCDVEYEMRRKDGTLLPVRLRGTALRSESGAFDRSIAVIEDLSEQRALEQKMFEAQKLESLAFMAGNIAHDFNNLLASVVGNAQLALRHASDIAGAASPLHNILAASARAADLCRQLLAYSGRGQFEIEDLELAGLVRELAEVLQVNVGKRVRIELQLDEPGGRVHVDATQIRQIVMNLVINAGEAIGERDGTITIRTTQCELDAATIAQTSHRDAVPGRYVELVVEDTGPGMTPDVRAQIFDPFFSTKGTGRGLGLAAVHGIVRGHHGTLQVASEPGRGTRFSIFLPLATADNQPRPRRPTPPLRPRGTIAIVEDDELLRDTLAMQLFEAGYDVKCTGDVEEALEMSRSAGIETFLVDVMLQHTSGHELARKLHGERPGVHVVLMSGYNQMKLPRMPNTRFLRKPFTEHELLHALERRR